MQKTLSEQFASPDAFINPDSPLTESSPSSILPPGSGLDFPMFNAEFGYTPKLTRKTSFDKTYQTAKLIARQSGMPPPPPPSLARSSSSVNVKSVGKSPGL